MIELKDNPAEQRVAIIEYRWYRQTSHLVSNFFVSSRELEVKVITFGGVPAGVWPNVINRFPIWTIGLIESFNGDKTQKTCASGSGGRRSLAQDNDVNIGHGERLVASRGAVDEHGDRTPLGGPSRCLGRNSSANAFDKVS